MQVSRELLPISEALFSDPRLSKERLIETFWLYQNLKAAEGGETNATDACLRLLLQRARKETAEIKSWTSHHPFFRLPAEDRFLFSCLKSNRYSYSRMARILECTLPEIERRLWKARLRFQQFPEISISVDMPASPRVLGPSCPEDDFSRPWVQRLIDDEIANSERLFLQNHMMSCDRCREYLSRYRVFAYRLEAEMPIFSTSSLGADGVIEVRPLKWGKESTKSQWSKIMAILHPKSIQKVPLGVWAFPVFMFCVWKLIFGS